jgi:hypothetical protein
VRVPISLLGSFSAAYGAACLRGLAELVEQPAGPPDIVVFLDADYSDHVDELPRLVEAGVPGVVAALPFNLPNVVNLPPGLPDQLKVHSDRLNASLPATTTSSAPVADASIVTGTNAGSAVAAEHREAATCVAGAGVRAVRS